MKRLVFDLDGVLAIDEPEKDDAERAPDGAVVAEILAPGLEGVQALLKAKR